MQRQFIDNLIKCQDQGSKMNVEDLRQLRKILTEIQIQNYFREYINKYIPKLYKDVYQSIKIERIQKLQSFFLQTMCNLITNNEKNSLIVFNLLKQEFEKNEQFYDQIYVMLWQNEKNRKFIYIFIYNMCIKIRQQVTWYQLTNHKMILLLTKFFLSNFQNKLNDQLFQWKSYVIILLFNYPKKQTTTFNLLWHQNSFQFLQFIFHMFVQIIQKKSTPTLISNLLPKSQQIISTYSLPYQFTFTFNLSDLRFLFQTFNSLHHSLLKQFNIFCTSNQSQSKSLHQISQKMNSILLIFCQITFLGGYNQAVQLQFFVLLKSISLYLQLIYNMYKIRQQRKISNFICHIIQESKKYLLQTLNLTKEQQLTKLLKIFNNLKLKETLPIILRLFSNIIHINKKNQIFFETQIKYTNMCMSLTELDTDLQTMREWSLILIRNLCECSKLIRQHIEGMKVQMNVTKQ